MFFFQVPSEIIFWKFQLKSYVIEWYDPLTLKKRVVLLLLFLLLLSKN